MPLPVKSDQLLAGFVTYKVFTKPKLQTFTKPKLGSIYEASKQLFSSDIKWDVFHTSRMYQLLMNSII